MGFDLFLSFLDFSLSKRFLVFLVLRMIFWPSVWLAASNEPSEESVHSNLEETTCCEHKDCFPKFGIPMLKAINGTWMFGVGDNV